MTLMSGPVGPRMLTDYRMAIGLLGASRALRAYYKPRASNAASRRGLQYENRVGKELLRLVTEGHFKRLEHGPWFTFTDVYGLANCSPDFLLWCDQGVVVVEVKLTWVEVAMHKLNDLYVPVVSLALQQPIATLVICRNITISAPRATFTIREALTSPTKLLHWPDVGHILW